MESFMTKDRNKKRGTSSREPKESHCSLENDEEIKDIVHENSGDNNYLFSIPKQGGLNRGRSFCQGMTESFERLRKEMRPSSSHEKYQQPKKILKASSNRSLNASNSSVQKVPSTNRPKKQTSMTDLRLPGFLPVLSPRMPKSARNASKPRKKSTCPSPEIRSSVLNIIDTRSTPNSERRIKSTVSDKIRPSTVSASASPRKNLKTRAGNIYLPTETKGATTISNYEDELNQPSTSESSSSTATGMKYRSNLSVRHHTPESASTSQCLKDLIDSLTRIKSMKYETSSSPRKGFGETLKDSLEDFINQTNFDVLKDCDEKLVGSHHMDEVDDMLGMEVSDAGIENDSDSANISLDTCNAIDISEETVVLDTNVENIVESLEPNAYDFETNVDQNDALENFVETLIPNVEISDHNLELAGALENPDESVVQSMELTDSEPMPIIRTADNETPDSIEDEIVRMIEDIYENSSNHPSVFEAEDSNDLLEQIRSAILETPLAGSDQELFLRRDVLSRMLKLPEQFNSKEVLTLMQVSPTALDSDSRQDLEFEENELQFRGTPVAPINAYPSEVNEEVASTFKEVRAIRIIIEKELDDLKNNYNPIAESFSIDSKATGSAHHEILTTAADSSTNEPKEPDLQFTTSRTEFIREIENELKEVDSCARWISTNLLEDLKTDEFNDNESSSEWNSSPREFKDESFRVRNLPPKHVQECPIESESLLKVKRKASVKLQDPGQKKPIKKSIKTKAKVKIEGKKYQNLSNQDLNNLSGQEQLTEIESMDIQSEAPAFFSLTREVLESNVKMSAVSFDAVNVEQSSSKWSPRVPLPAFAILHEVFAPANYGFHFGQLSTYGQSTDRRKISSQSENRNGSCDGDSFVKEYQDELFKSPNEVELVEPQSELEEHDPEKVETDYVLTETELELVESEPEIIKKVPDLAKTELELVDSEQELVEPEPKLTENMENSENIQTLPESIHKSKTYVLPAGTFRPSFLEFDVEDRNSTSEESSTDEEDDCSQIISASSSEDEIIIEPPGVQYCQGVPIIPSATEVGRDIRSWFDNTVGQNFQNLKPLDEELQPITPESNVLEMEKCDQRMSLTQEEFASDMKVAESSFNETVGMDLDYKNPERWRRVKIGSRKVWEERNNHMQTNFIYVPAVAESSSSEVSSSITAALSSQQLSCRNGGPDESTTFDIDTKERCRGDLFGPSSLQKATPEIKPAYLSTNTRRSRTRYSEDESEEFPSIVKTTTRSRLSRVRNWIGRIVNPCIEIFRKNK